MEPEATPPKVRLAEVIGCLSLATDLAIGLPLEHGMRRALLAVWLGEEVGLDSEVLSSVYYVALLGSVACVLNAAAFSDCLRDEIDFRGRMFALDLSRPLPVAAYLARRAGEGDPPWRRARKLFSLVTQTQATSRDIALHCGELLDLGPAIKQALGQCDEHWDGRLAVLGLKGEEISLPARLFLIAQDIDVHFRAGGVDEAVAVVRQRAGKLYDPSIAEIFCRVAPSLLTRLNSISAWDGLLAAEPAPLRLLSPNDLNEVLKKIANFVDMRSPYTVGHSPAVAGLAENAAHTLGLSGLDATNLRLGGLVHDLGRAGVPVSAWNKKSALNSQERERMRQHPSLTEVVLARSAVLGRLGPVAGLHHERLDGSGYRGVSAASLSVTARVLATADAYQSKIEPRPHRAAMDPGAAAGYLRRQAAERKLDGDCVNAMLQVAGQPRSPRKGVLPSGLSDREAEVLRLAVRGLTNREMAEALFVSPKTVGHHIESIYRKAGVSTRAGATIFALRHGLVGDSA